MLVGDEMSIVADKGRRFFIKLAGISSLDASGCRDVRFSSMRF